MRLTTAIAAKPRYLQTADTTSLQAPTGGWDAVSALANMPKDRAVTLDNFIPRVGWIEPRRGFKEWATGLIDVNTPVETVMAYYAPDVADDKLFGVAGTTIYDCTSEGAAVATTETALTSARCQYTTFVNSSGAVYLVVCNGADNTKIYDGSAWTDITISGPGSDDLIVPYSYQGILWFVEKQSTSVWYFAPGAISGTATAFEVGPYLTLGGYIMTVCSWSVDTRQTVNDYFAIISSRGQVVVYVGTDPASVNTWQLVGVYNLAHPVGRRCAVKIGGDLAIITQDGITSMNTMLLADRTGGVKGSITARILNAVNDAVSHYSNNFGWQFISWPKESLAFLNIPVAENDEAMQFVRNNLTGAWCRFLGINANCWELFGDDLYFGGNDGVVYLYNWDTSDNGEPIVAQVNTAFNYFETRGYAKQFTMVRPIFTTDNFVIPGVGINVNFGQGAIVSTPDPLVTPGAEWDSAVWDDAVWPVESAVSTDWLSVSGIGNCASIVVKVAVGETGTQDGATIQLQSFDLMYLRAGPLG